ncbi:hypothetical protein WAZ07_16320 [Bacillus sp. FJAT-51639]|uniref:SMI1/KNR4 family protein n=1 Tax=Bacillus bruguierae TaxID=3127667 RepID=A0ABU8FJI5_9BACI
MKRTVNWRFLDKSVSEETIKNIAKEIGVKIPTNYINCAINHHGAGVKPYCFKIEEKKELPVIYYHLIRIVVNIF